MSTDAEAVTPHDRADYRRIAVLTFGIVLAIFAVGVSVQSVFVLGILPHSMVRSAPVSVDDGGIIEMVPIDITLNLVVRLAANGAGVVAGVLMMLLLAPQERGTAGRIGTGVLIALATAGARSLLQIVLGIYHTGDVIELLAESATAVIATAVALTIAMVQVDARRRLRTEERASAQQALRASAALEALQSDELRLRRDVADGLHGTVQQRFVLLSARLDAAVTTLERTGETPEVTRELRTLGADLDLLREQDLRAMGHLLYPERLDQGAVPAIRALFQRVPGTISTVLGLSDGLLEYEAHGSRRLSPERRLLLVRLVEEALSNALKHGRATALELTVRDQNLTPAPPAAAPTRGRETAGAASESGSRGARGSARTEPTVALVPAFVVTFDDDGSGLPEEPALRGLRRLSDQLLLIGGELTLTASPLGGARVVATVPVG